ncbi:MAG: penicillin-binding protein 2 [Prevotella sp.]|nr:penicillin-binding protein 2 [Prevotella sp.]MDY5685263.1 penicillin-binding protein 2 [Prevotella sp.]
MKDYNLENRRLVIGGVAVVIVAIYLVRLFTLQLMSDDYKKNADSNAFLKKIEFPSRGAITDRNGRLLVYNQPAYDIMVIMNEESGRLDTTEFCQSLGITKEFFIQRMNDIKDRTKNPGYSRFTQQLFMSQLSNEEFSMFQEKIFRFPGFYVQPRSIRQYQYKYAAHILGDVGEVSPSDIEDDDYYMPGDYIGKLGVEKYYEKELRGEKGVQIMLRDARGRIQGKYQNGKYDRRPVAGKDLTLSIDLNLQALGERLLEGKRGSIVAIDPRTGEVLCMVSSPTYDPRIMVGRQRGKNHRLLSHDLWKPLLNRSIMGMYPPGSTFKTSQALTFMSEGIISPGTAFPCHHGFYCRGLHVGCHSHPSPISLVNAISTSCNGYFCWGLYYMMGNRRKYKNVQDAMSMWRDYMVSMGFGYKLGIDLPGEKRGMIPNADYYDRNYHGSWNGLTIISISIGQGEVTLTPLQIANLGATIANRGYFYTPHVVRKVQGEPLDTAYTRRHYTKASQRAYNYVVAGMRSSALKGTCRMLGKYDFEACGKTGTAQNRGHDHSVFMGFAPMNEPKIAISVYVENGGWGADYGVPIGGLMMEQYLKGKLSPASEAQAAEFQRRRIGYGPHFAGDDSGTKKRRTQKPSAKLHTDSAAVKRAE